MANGSNIDWNAVIADPRFQVLHRKKQSFLTGLMMWDVQRFEGLIGMVGGLRVVNTVHVLMCILFIGFIITHIYMGFLGAKPSSHYKEMFTGYEEPHA